MAAIRIIDDHLELANIGSNTHAQIDAHIAAANNYVKRDGSLALTADWDIGDTRKILADEIRARDGDGLKLHDDGGNGIFVDDGGNVGIGTDAPGYPVDIVGSIRTYTNGGSNYQHAISYRNSSYGGGLSLRHARGTITSPININNGDFGGLVQFQGYAGTSFKSMCLIDGRGDGVVSSTSMPGKLQFSTTPNGATSGTIRAVIKQDGKIGISTTTPTALLDINSDILRLRTAKTPATAGAAGNTGDMGADANYFYRCVSTNSWKRAALNVW